MGYASDEIMRLDMVEKSTMESLLAMPVTPEVKNADKGKYLHANESTGALEWAEGGSSGGGVLVVNLDISTYTLDKTWQEIFDAPFAVIMLQQNSNKTVYHIATITSTGSTYSVAAFSEGEDAVGETIFVTDSADGYPVLQASGGGGD